MEFEPIDRGVTAMCRRICACLFVLSLTASVSPLRAQSLADVSRAEEERRKTIKVPAKVYTNKDLKSVPPPAAPEEAPPTPAAPAESQAASEGAAEPEKPAPDGAAGQASAAKGQAYWGTRAKELRDKLDQDRTFAQALQSRINALTTDFENRSDPAQRSVVEQDRNKALSDLERLNKIIVDDQKAISDFDDDARRAGVPPGWLR